MISIKPPRKCLFRNANVADAKTIHAMEYHATGCNRGSLSDLVAFLASDTGNAALCQWQSIGKPLVGYLLYDCFHDRELIVLRELLVHPRYRKSGIGYTFLSHIKQFCRKENYHAIARVPESNLPAQILLRHSGWPCDRILRNFFGPEQHAYRFIWPEKQL